MEIPIADGFYRSSSLPISSQQCVNFYPQVTATENFQRQSLFGTPGLTQIVAVTGSHCRGGLEMSDIPYFVFGTSLYRLNSTLVDSVETFTTTNLGTISGTGNVSMAQNGTELMVLVPGGNGYIYNDSTSAFSQITDSDFTANGNPQHVRFIDGYFVCSTDSKKFIVSNLNQGLVWDALDFGSAEADPDNIVAPHVHNGRLYLLGSETTQAFQNIGGTSFPFQAIPAFVLPKGCYAPFSVVEGGDTFMFVGGGEREAPGVWAFAGQGFQKISTEGIDFLLGELNTTDLENIVGFSYSERGASFVGFNLVETTIVYDTSTGRWHERKSRIYDSYGYPAEVAWRASHVVRAYQRTLVGDRLSGKIGYADLDVYDEYGEEILRYVVTQPLENETNGFSISRIEATTESGAASINEVEPQIRLSLSRNGEVFGAERSRSMGKVGERNKRQIWWKNGHFPRRASLKFSFSDKAKIALVKVDADFA
ncbi:MAG: hypothetical protein CMO77_07195 [Verrucomicrobiales bacterium]|jgi:hypothetical protein|nr:hypothetical protein [Verrucomicrobiales bacterium]